MEWAAAGKATILKHRSYTMRNLATGILGIGLMLIAAGNTWAKPQATAANSNAADIEVSKTDANPPEVAFPYPEEFVQGEYSGTMLVDGRWQTYGMQVVARGSGKFSAKLFSGGLPSEKNLRPYPTELEGQVQDNHLRLKSVGGLEFEFLAAPVYQFVQYDSQRKIMAQLLRIQRYSTTLGLDPPAGAVVLFRDGQIGELANASLSPAGNLAIGATTNFPVEDFHLHVEFRLPFQADKSNQDRGNSGIYIQRRYELQILDSFGEPPLENNAGSIYRRIAPLGNMSLPPLAWQTYDIWFTAARWTPDGKKISNARVTLKHNGIVVHDNTEIPGKTGAGWAEGPEPQAILFQDHRDPVEFRNVWLLKGTY
jgi:hypothetical protein